MQPETDPKVLRGSQQTLEDAFFARQDRQLIENLQKLRQMEETRKALAEVSGIRNHQMLDRLVALNVRPETLASLALVPLVDVGWADGSMDAAEKKALLRAADQAGFHPGSVNYALLEEWTLRRPGPDLLEAWTHYVRGLCELLSRDERLVMCDQLVVAARVVAHASGGFLGFGRKASDEELAMIKKIESAFLD